MAGVGDEPPVIQNGKVRTILLAMRRTAFSATYVLSLGFVLVLCVAGQIVGTQSSDHVDAVDLERKAESALERVQRNDVGVGIVDATEYIEWAAHVEPRRAIPVLGAYFVRSREPDLRNEIASVLVSLGDEDPQFWNLILNEAKAALREDPPNPFEIKRAGETSVPCSSEAFLVWAKNRNLSLEEARTEVTVGLPQRLRPLANSGGPRVIPILREALKSRNPMIQVIAAHGLVLTGDRARPPSSSMRLSVQQWTRPNI